MLKRVQLGLIHVAVAMTLVPINSTLNRVMIKELSLSATLVAVLASFPYLLSPIQVFIGAYSDRHPILGYRRSPYILTGLLLCALGVFLSPYVAFLLAKDLRAGSILALLAFGAWGMGYNLASVSYFSLATELFGENNRGKTIAIMFFMMTIGIIATAIGLSRMLNPYTPEALIRAFAYVAVYALILGLAGLLGLEPRFCTSVPVAQTYSFSQIILTIVANPVARLFFLYLLLLLAAILGQDILLEPFAAEAFGMTVTQTTRLTSLWGVFVILATLVTGAFEGHLSKRTAARSGNLGAFAGFLLIVFSGFTRQLSIFYAGVTLLGIGTGIATVANLSLMFDFTTPINVGLYIGAWGFSNALSRLTGSLLSGIVRDGVTHLSNQALFGYLVVFSIEAAMLLTATLMLKHIDVQIFREKAEHPSFVERIALAVEN